MKLDVSRLAGMDASLMAYWGAYALAEGGRHRKLADALFMQSAIPHPLFNSVILTGRDSATIDEALELSAGCVSETGVPVLWRVNLATESDELRSFLEQAGLERREPDPAMLFDLSDLPPAPIVDGLLIRAADGTDARRDWGELTIEAFEMEKSLGLAMGACEATMPAALFQDHLRFTGYLDGEAVAVSSLVMTDDIAGIYAVGTLPKARSRGIGTAMTLHAMREGVRRGATVATLQATEMGEPVYERIGFRTVFNYQNYLQT